MKTSNRIKNNQGSGFVILFAFIIAGIIFSIALGVAQIALKEIKFSASGRDTNDAFFAADTGIECALFNDKPPSNSFAQAGSGTVQCLGRAISLSGSFPSWDFVVTGLGSTGFACAKVNVFKDDISDPPFILTNMTSRGYNIGDSACLSSNLDRTEREIQVFY